MRRTTAYLALPVVLLAGCGTQTVGQNNHGTAPQPSSPTEIQAAIVARHQQWAGTADDLQAAQVIHANALNGEYDACMQAKGYAEFDFRNQIGLSDDAPDSGLIGLLEPFGQHTLRDQALSTARSLAIEYRSNNPETEYKVWNDDVEAATDECLAETQAEAASDDEIEELLQPAGLDGLYADWYGDKDLQKALLFGVDNAKDYATCMQTHGFGDGEIHETDDASPTLMRRLRGEIELPAQEAWQTVSDPARRDNDPDWNAFIAAEQAWLDADERCRTDLVAENIPAIWAFQQDFEAEYADKISDVEQGWATIREDAAELGWAPNKPFAR
jgi:hypothetical protein